MREVQTIIFDLGAVIINTKTDKEWLEEDLLPNFEHEPLEQLFLQNFFKHFETGQIPVSEFIRTMKGIAVDKEDSVEKIIKHWNGNLKDIPVERVELLRRLKTKYKLILASNTNALHHEAIQKYMEEKFGEDILENNFHASYFSYKIGLRKPHREIYELIIQEQHPEPAHCIFLDDRPENLIEPSLLGIPTLLVDKDITHLLADY